MKSARINFGQPHTEYKLEINEAGEATSCYNQNTETEYIGGGGGGDCPTLEQMATVVLQTIPAQTVNITIAEESGYYGETKIADLNDAAQAAIDSADISFSFSANGISNSEHIALDDNWSINYQNHAIYLVYYAPEEPSPIPTEYNAPEIVIYIATEELKEIFTSQLEAPK